MNPTRNHSDDDLADRLSHGDHTALEELYQIYGIRVYGTIQVVVQNHFVTEELVQEVFLKAWTRSQSFERRHARSLAAWMVAIARNRALDYVRSHENRLAHSSRELVSTDGLSHDPKVEERISRQRQTVSLMSAFGRLPEAQRVVLTDVYFEGLTHAQTAHRQGRPLGTVKTWVRQALATLRTELSAA